MPADPSTLSLPTRAGYFASNIIIRGVIGLAGMLPYRLRIPLTGWLVARMAPLVGFTKRIRNNLALACPDLPQDDVDRLCREVPDNAGRTMMEMYAGKAFLDRANQWPISGPGVAALEEARAAGRPVLIMTGHFGNYLAARAKLAQMGHQVGGLYRRMANPYFNSHYVAAMESTGKPLFEQGRRGMMELVRHLKGGGIAAILGDLHAHGGRELNFFGQPAVTSIVPAELALKYDALLLPVYAVRQPDGLNFSIVALDPVPHTDPETMTQIVNDGLESLVRNHMEQWFWIHRRWKPWYDLGLQSQAVDSD